MKRLSFICFIAALFLPLSTSALTLSEGLKTVVEAGRDVTIARSDEDTARGALSLARSHWLPTVDLYGNQTWMQYQPEFKTPFGPFPSSQSNFLTYGFQATETLYDFGRTSSSVDAARYGLKSREIETERTRNQSALDFIIAYLDLLESEKLLQVSKEEVQLYEAHKKDAEDRLNAGVITRNEVLQAEVTLVDSRQREVSAENRCSVRASRINSLLLKPLNDDVHAEEVEASPASGLSLEDAWTIAAKESPELKDLDAKIAASEDNVKATEAEYLPTLYLSGGYQYQANRYIIHEDNWTLIAGVNVNLYSGGATSSRMQMARSEVRSLQLIRDKTLDTIRLEVKSAYLDLKSSALKIEVTKTAIDQARENLRLQRLRYQEGVGTATDVLDAVTLLSTAESNSWKALYDMKRAEAKLLYAMGRDLAGVYGQ
ncbi:MAG TPA: TolC family protein [Nitrospirota bacterium]|nr:TolC family protein [Nitrospirota bacterium]